MLLPFDATGGDATICGGSLLTITLTGNGAGNTSADIYAALDDGGSTFVGSLRIFATSRQTRIVAYVFVPGAKGFAVHVNRGASETGTIGLACQEGWGGTCGITPTQYAGVVP